MKQIFFGVLLSLLLVTRGRSTEPYGDLTLAQYKQIAIALAQGDESKLPLCLPAVCSEDQRHLIRATALRIQWSLASSLSEASLCVSLSRGTHVATHYTCARLLSADAQSLFGFYGTWSTIQTLADAVQQACEAKLWGNSGSCLSAPIFLQASKLRSLHLSKDEITYSPGIKSIPLLGDGRVQSYSDDGHDKVNITTAVAYPSVKVSINGKDALMTIDTGAQTTTLYSTATTRLGVTGLSGSEIDVMGITGAPVKHYSAIVDSFEFANVKILHKFVEVEKNNFSLPTDGIIGLDVLDKMHALVFTKNALILTRSAAQNCSNSFTISSSLYSNVNGIVAKGAEFNGLPVVAIIDTGNLASEVAPTWQFVQRQKIPVSNRHRIYSGSGTNLAMLESADINGTLDYLGRRFSGAMSIAASYADGGIDFNIGAPFFYGQNLYIDFDRKKICIGAP